MHDKASTFGPFQALVNLSLSKLITCLLSPIELKRGHCGARSNLNPFLKYLTCVIFQFSPYKLTVSEITDFLRNTAMLIPFKLFQAISSLSVYYYWGQVDCRT